MAMTWHMSRHYNHQFVTEHYNVIIMGAMASQITSPTSVYSNIYSGADQRKHQSSAWLAFVWWIHRWPVTSPHKGPGTQKMFPFDDVIMQRVIFDPYINVLKDHVVKAVIDINWFLFVIFWQYAYLTVACDVMWRTRSGSTLAQLITVNFRWTCIWNEKWKLWNLGEILAYSYILKYSWNSIQVN